MKQTILVKWLEEGQLTIPQALLMHYHELGLTETELVLLLQIESFRQKASLFPSMTEIAERMTMASNEIMRLVEALVHKQFLAIEIDQGTVMSERYSLEPLWERLIAFYENEELAEKTQEITQLEQNLYRLFEAEFGRPLSPLEAEMLGQWLDQDKLDPVLIKEALKEAVLNAKLSFRYIDRILLNWTKKGVKTVEEAHSIAEDFQKHQSQKSNIQNETIKKSEGRVPFYDWLEKRKG